MDNQIGAGERAFFMCTRSSESSSPCDHHVWALLSALAVGFPGAFQVPPFRPALLALSLHLSSRLQPAAVSARSMAAATRPLPFVPNNATAISVPAPKSQFSSHHHGACHYSAHCTLLKIYPLVSTSTFKQHNTQMTLQWEQSAISLDSTLLSIF